MGKDEMSYELRMRWTSPEGSGAQKERNNIFVLFRSTYSLHC
jgi:hypothetical protein